MFHSKTSLFVIFATIVSGVLYQSPYVIGQSFTNCVPTETADVNYVCLWSGTSPIVVNDGGVTVTLGTDSYLFSICDTTAFSAFSCICALWVDPADSSDFNIDETCNSCSFVSVTEFSFAINWDCTNRLTGECASYDATGCTGNNQQPSPTAPPQFPIAAPQPVPLAAAPQPVPVATPQLNPTNPPQLPTLAPILSTGAPLLPTIAPVLPTIAPVLQPPTIPPMLPTIAPQLPPATGAPILVPTTELPTSAPVTNTIQAPTTSVPIDRRTAAPIIGTSDGNAFGSVRSTILGFVIMFGITFCFSM